MADFSNEVKDAAGSAWSGAAETVKGAASSARDATTGAFRDSAARIVHAGSNAAEAASGHIRDLPLSSALLFLGVGFIAGCLIPRR
ncbi:MAG TPA: hypothetical protein VH020_08905 [Stellaceae bacterium]|jgi:ElaB/YqjD/DUF883 family membrane-anchored ribosome-binding protein|nr:hypothetical protein [Stellaceae bacterium]